MMTPAGDGSARRGLFGRWLKARLYFQLWPFR